MNYANLYKKSMKLDINYKYCPSTVTLYAESLNDTYLHINLVDSVHKYKIPDSAKVQCLIDNLEVAPSNVRVENHYSGLICVSLVPENFIDGPGKQYELSIKVSWEDTDDNLGVSGAFEVITSVFYSSGDDIFN